MSILRFDCYSISTHIKIFYMGEGELGKKPSPDALKLMLDLMTFSLGMTLPSAKIIIKCYSSPTLLSLLLFFWNALAFFFFSNFYFFHYRWFIVFCQFLLYSKVAQSHIYIYIYIHSLIFNSFLFSLFYPSLPLFSFSFFFVSSSFKYFLSILYMQSQMLATRDRVIHKMDTELSHGTKYLRTAGSSNHNIRPSHHNV